MKKTILSRQNIALEFMSNFGLGTTFDRMGWIIVGFLWSIKYIQH